jgi:hypothetical protein
MGIVQSTPGEFAPAYNCLPYELKYDGDIVLNTGTQASITITFVNGGTATDGNFIYIAGQKFEINQYATSIDGYYYKYSPSSFVDSATWMLNTLSSTLFFNPEKVNIISLSVDSVTIIYNQVGQQPDWQFEDGGLSAMTITATNGTDRIVLKDPAYVWAVYEDRAALSLPPLKIVSERVLPLVLDFDNSSSPASVTVVPQIVDISKDIKDLLKTTLPSVYSPIFTPINDSLFRMLIGVRAGLRYLVDCNQININQGFGEFTWVYNSLFQKTKITDLYNILDPYIFGNKPLLIKNTYTLCRSSNMFVWSLCNESPLEVVYYDSSGAALESSSFTYGDSDNELKPTFMNVGCFGQTIPSNCAYYVLNYMNTDGSEVLHAVRINVVSCGCIEGEFIFCTDLGGYETILMDKAVKHEIPVQSEVIQSAIGCTVTSLIKGGRSIVNKETESVFTFEKWVDTDTADELEYIAQFQRSQSFYMKQFIDAADSYAYLKVIPENITFVPQEIGKRPKLTFTIRFNQNFKSHPQNEAVFI